MANTIKPKRSYTTSNTPTLASGEVGVNAADGKIWIGNAAGNANVLVSSLAFSDHTGTVSNSQLSTTAVSAGSYNNANITVNAQGRVTAASNGSSGTVTSIATTSPITGGTITGTGTIGINAASANTASYVVQRDASGNFSAGTITASLTGNASSATNIAGGGAGQVPYNTGSGATSFLGAGTSGQILRSNGTSAPTWESQGLFSGGRLTLSSGVPVTTTDISSSTIYYTPYNGDEISLYDGTNWATYSFTERSLALGTLTSGRPYDVFMYNNSGTLTLEILAWSSDTARATALVLTNGVYLKSGALTRRYLGTFRTTSTTTTADSLNNRLLWNVNNQVERPVIQNSNTYYPYSGHTYTTAAWRSWNNDSGLRLGYVVGLERGISVGFGCASGGAFASQGAAWDGSTPAYDTVDLTGRAGRTYSTRTAVLGYHYITMMEYGTAGSTYIQGILEGTFWC